MFFNLTSSFEAYRKGEISTYASWINVCILGFQKSTMARTSGKPGKKELAKSLEDLSTSLCFHVQSHTVDILKELSFFHCKIVYGGALISIVISQQDSGFQPTVCPVVLM